MTDQHPITPPPELALQWINEYLNEHPEGVDVEVLVVSAAQWGADQELEACVKLLELSDKNARDFLYSARRPKPPSLKERALLAIDIAVADDRLSADVANVVRRALEQLPE